MASQSQKSGACLFKQARLFGKIRYVVCYVLIEGYQETADSMFQFVIDHCVGGCIQVGMSEARC